MLIIQWERKGATGWGWQAMKKYFKVSENYTPNPEYNVDVSVGLLVTDPLAEG
jgi:hypothetical protein